MRTKFVIFQYMVLFISNVYNENTPLNSFFDISNSVSEFSRYKIVKPKIYHGKEKREILSTKEKTGEHTNHLQIAMKIDGKDVVLDLILNKHLLKKGFFHKYQENEEYKIYRPNFQEVDLCEYYGKLRGKPNSWVTLSTCNGLSGVIFDGTEIHYIEKKDDYGDVDSDHYLYRHSDLLEHNKTCGYVGDEVNPKKTHFYSNNQILRFRRNSNQPSVREPYNANNESRYVELVFVVDNKIYNNLEKSNRKVVNRIKAITNVLNGLYSSLNIFIALVGVVIWTEKDAIDLHDASLRVSKFVEYRKKHLIKSHPNDNAQLLTKFNFENKVIGKAYIGTICQVDSVGVIEDHSPVVGIVAATVAHEMGHNFGMGHDTSQCVCPDDYYCIMAGSLSNVPPKHWSSCSLKYLQETFAKGMDQCLKNKPKTLFESSTCGNGFVELGEQCDCGLEEHCDNHCCNATTCLIQSNAKCATGGCCDLSTCQLKTVGTTCRSIVHDCDLPEYCSGKSEYCPEDFHKLDTETCDEEKSFCYDGFCSTKTKECKNLPEIGISKEEQCYETVLTRYCGNDGLIQSYLLCEDQEVLCGILDCKRNTNLFSKRTKAVSCETEIVHSGLTLDGSLCENRKKCINLKCMSVSSLKKQRPRCPDDCNGNGWCNNKGNCHCKDSFAPPNCFYPGSGGSIDSGPTSEPNAHQVVVTAIFVIFLGVVPLIAIVFLYLSYMRYNPIFCVKKSTSKYFQQRLKPLFENDKFVSHKPTLIPTISANDSKQKNIQSDKPIIKMTGLISTTNIDKSNTIGKNVENIKSNFIKPNIMTKPKRRNIKNFPNNNRNEVINSSRTYEPDLEEKTNISVKDLAKRLELINRDQLQSTKSPNKSSGPSCPSKPAKQTENNHSLLREKTPPPSLIGFSNIKGFSISPLKNLELQPVRSAPPPSVVTNPTINLSIPHPAEVNSTLKNGKISVSPRPSLSEPQEGLYSEPIQKYNSRKKISIVNNVSAVPTLPPRNLGSKAKPIITSPVLESSTYFAIEHMPPL